MSDCAGKSSWTEAAAVDQEAVELWSERMALGAFGIEDGCHLSN